MTLAIYITLGLILLIFISEVLDDKQQKRTGNRSYWSFSISLTRKTLKRTVRSDNRPVPYSRATAPARSIVPFRGDTLIRYRLDKSFLRLYVPEAEAAELEVILKVIQYKIIILQHYVVRLKVFSGYGDPEREARIHGLITIHNALSRILPYGVFYIFIQQRSAVFGLSGRLIDEVTAVVQIDAFCSVVYVI